MKIVTFSIFLAVLLTGYDADSPNDSKKIHTLIQKLVNARPNTDEVHSLWHPVSLPIDEHVNVSTIEFQKQSLDFEFQNITQNGTALKSNKRENQYTEFTCTFHEYLQIDHAVKPKNLQIKGIYVTKSFGAENFTVNQYAGRMHHKVSNTGATETEIMYIDEEIKVGKSTRNQVISVRAMGELIKEIKNNTINKLNKTLLSSKIANFQHIFPFLNGCLLPQNRTAMRLPENTYAIRNNATEQWKSLRLSLLKVIIFGINDFKQAKITAHQVGDIGARFNMTIDTNPLEGSFIWNYSKGDIFSKKTSYNFSMDSLVISADVTFDYGWNVDYVDANIGEIRINRDDYENPDVNEFMYHILHEHLKEVITARLKEHIRDGYLQRTTQRSFNDLQKDDLQTLLDMYGKAKNEQVIPTRFTANASVTSFQESWIGRSEPDVEYYKRLMKTRTTAEIPKSDNNACVDKRKLWQRIFLRNPCSSMNQTKTQCVDNRRFLTKLFLRNPCKQEN